MAEEEQELFLKWAASMGISDAPRPPPPHSSSSSSCLGSSLTISTFPAAGGRGLGAVRDISKGELILTVPKVALLSLHSAKEDCQLVKILQLHRNLSSVQILVIHLLIEVAKGKTSKWYPYLLLLPRFHHTLAHFSDFEAQSLQVEDAKWTSKMARDRARKEWEEAWAVLQALGLKVQLTTFNAWLWASATVSSRTLHVPWDSAGALCPVGDLFNYANPCTPFLRETADAADQSKGKIGDTPQTSWAKEIICIDKTELLEDDIIIEKGSGINIDEGYGVCTRGILIEGRYEPELSAYCFYAREAYRKGDQVLLCYGLYNNLELLEHYGFFLPHNAGDSIYLCLPNSDHNQGLGSLKLGPPTSQHIQADGRPSFSLLAALRLHFVPADLRKRRGYLAFSGMQISVENDMSAFLWLQETCQKLIGCLPTSLKGDTILFDIISTSSVDGLTSLLEFNGINTKCSCIDLNARDVEKLLQDQECGWAALSGEEKQEVLVEIQSFLHFHHCDTIGQKSAKKGLIDIGELWLERWRLSVQWRLAYKKMLHRCIAFCADQLQDLR